MSKQLKADLLLLLTTALWGASFPIMKNILSTIPVLGLLSTRFIIAAVLLMIIFWKKIKNVSRRTLLYGFILSIFLFAGMGLQVWGLTYTTAQNSGFITGMTVVFVPIFAAYLFKRKPNAYAWAGVILAFSGLFFITGGVDFIFNIGDFLTLLCSISFAFMIIFVDKYARIADADLIGILPIIFCSIFFTMAWAIDPQPMVLDMNSILAIIYTGIFATAIAFWLQAKAQRVTTPTHTAIIFTAEPVFAVIFALFIPDALGNFANITPTTIIGCVLIFLGMLACEAKIFMKTNTLV